eukprot:c22614_g1_i6 orf=511-1716(+)
MSRFKRSFLAPQQFYKSLYVNPLSYSVENNSQRTGAPVPGLHLCRGTSVVCDNAEVLKENKLPKHFQKFVEKDSEDLLRRQYGENGVTPPGAADKSPNLVVKELVSLRTKSTQTWVHSSESAETSDFLPPSTPNHRLHVWHDPDCDVAPASAWSTLANRTLLCRPLPLDVGCCTCYVLREHEAGEDSPTVYSLYTDEGQGRRDRRLAVARHRRRSGRSEFVVVQNSTGVLTKSEDGFFGSVRSNILGSRYFAWEQIKPSECNSRSCRQLLGVVTFEPTVTSFSGTFRVIQARIPKNHSIQMSNCAQHAGFGLTKDWGENMGNVHQLFSRKPSYNRETKRYELDFRDRSKQGSKIKASVKNFQLIMEETGKQVVLLFGKVGKSKYIMEYRYENCHPCQQSIK